MKDAWRFRKMDSDVIVGILNNIWPMDSDL